MSATTLVLPIACEDLSALAALAHEVTELRQKALTAWAFGLHSQAADFAQAAQARAAELVALCARVGRSHPPGAPSLTLLQRAA